MPKSRLPLLNELLNISLARLTTRIPVVHIAPSSLPEFLYFLLFIFRYKSLHFHMDSFLNLGRIRFLLQFTFLHPRTAIINPQNRWFYLYRHVFRTLESPQLTITMGNTRNIQKKWIATSSLRSEKFKVHGISQVWFIRRVRPSYELSFELHVFLQCLPLSLTWPAKRVCSSTSRGRPNAACSPQEAFLLLPE
jgi:hypothetical protein